MLLIIELNRNCQLKCKHCSSVNKKNVLSFDDIQPVLRNYSIKKIVLSGGEPFLHPQIYELISFLTEKYQVSLCTNGIVTIPNEIVPQFHKIYVSVYGWKAFHNFITNSDSFDDTLFSLISAGIQMKSVRRTTSDVLINSPVFGEKTRQLVHIANIGQFPIRLTRLLPHGRAEKIKVLSREKQLKIAENIKKKYPDTIITCSLLHEHCNWENKLTLLPSGGLIHCVTGKLYPFPNQQFVCDKVAQGEI